MHDAILNVLFLSAFSAIITGIITLILILKKNWRGALIFNLVTIISAVTAFLNMPLNIQLP